MFLTNKLMGWSIYYGIASITFFIASLFLLLSKSYTLAIVFFIIHIFFVLMAEILTNQEYLKELLKRKNE